jgi:nucleoside-diphosphate-sugar epimerase
VQGTLPQRFTILGGQGFIGSHLVTFLRSRGHDCVVPARDEMPLRHTGSLGHVVYCIGLTADFRSRPFDTVDAHTGLFSAFLRSADFESLLYLSSTRLYQSGGSGSENASFTVDPADPSHLYDLSKLTAECLCLSLDRSSVRVARLANVYGPDFQSDNFLTCLLRDATRLGALKLQSHRESAKDYVALADVVEMLERIALAGSSRMYNVASGHNVSNGEIVAKLQELSGCLVEWVPGSSLVTAPPLRIDRLQSEFGYRPKQLRDELPSLFELFRSRPGTAAGKGPAYLADGMPMAIDAR